MHFQYVLQAKPQPLGTVAILVVVLILAFAIAFLAIIGIVGKLLLRYEYSHGTGETPSEEPPQRGYLVDLVLWARERSNYEEPARPTNVSWSLLAVMLAGSLVAVTIAVNQLLH